MVKVPTGSSKKTKAKGTIKIGFTKNINYASVSVKLAKDRKNRTLESAPKIARANR